MSHPDGQHIVVIYKGWKWRKRKAEIDLNTDVGKPVFNSDLSDKVPRSLPKLDVFPTSYIARNTGVIV